MKKLTFVFILLFLTLTAYGKSENTLNEEPRTMIGILDISERSKGGLGYDSCLGSPFYKLRLSTGIEVKLSPSLYLRKNNLQTSDFNKLLRKRIKITGYHIKEMSVREPPKPNSPEEKIQIEVFSNLLTKIPCNHIQILNVEVLE